MDCTTQPRAARVSARKADQYGNLFGRLFAAANASRGQAQRLLHASAGLSIAEWRILWDLVEAGPLSIQDMASIQRIDHSLISRALPAMRDKGYVRTAPNVADRRQSLVEVTQTGLRAFHIAAPVMKRRRESLAQAFTDRELDRFLALIGQFEAFLDQPIDTDIPLEENP